MRAKWESWAYGRGRRKVCPDHSFGHCNQGEINLMASDKEGRVVCKIPELIRAVSP